MLGAIDRSLRLFYDEPETFRYISRRNMREDFGWDRSAERYLAIYRSM